MSYTVNVEPDIVREAESYAVRNGTTLDAMIRACMLVIVSRGTLHEPLDGDTMTIPHKKQLQIGSMREEITLPKNFDQEFDGLDTQISKLFNGLPS